MTENSSQNLYDEIYNYLIVDSDANSIKISSENFLLIIPRNYILIRKSNIDYELDRYENRENDIVIRMFSPSVMIYIFPINQELCEFIIKYPNANEDTTRFKEYYKNITVDIGLRS